jgi:hypothetical protein
VRIREASVNEPPLDASKWRKMTSKPGSPRGPGKSMAATYLLAMRCPVYRRRDSNLGFGQGTWEPAWRWQGKRHKRRTREAESTDAP